MFGRKRITAGRVRVTLKTSEVTEKREKLCQTLFEDIVEKSINTRVDPSSCIPFACLRKESRSGVERLKALFNGEITTTFGATCAGISAGSNNPVVIELSGSHQSYLFSYFREKGMSKEEVKTHISSRTTWYGIVDGLHRNLALRELAVDDREKWGGYQWHVTVLNGGHSLQRLKQFGRVQNSRNNESFFVEGTMFDLLHGLKQEFNRLRNERNGKRPTAGDVAAAFDGTTHAKETTLKQAAVTAARLSCNTISTLGEIMTSEHPEICQTVLAKTCSDTVGSTKSVMSRIDCRVFKKFVNLTSLKSSREFMTALGEEGEAAQCLTLHRAKHISKTVSLGCSSPTTIFKSVSHKKISEQFKISEDALLEERKFIKFLDGDDWPSELRTVRENLLRTTILDSEIMENRGNSMTILPSLLAAFERVAPAHLSQKMQKYLLLCGNSNPRLQEDRNGEHIDCESHSSIEMVMPNTDKTMVDPLGQDEPIEIQSLQVECEEDAEKRLALEYETSVADRNLPCFQMSWKEYEAQVRKDDDKLFDMIITQAQLPCSGDPPLNGVFTIPDYENKDMKSFVQFCSRVLRPGGYVILFTTSILLFSPWIYTFSTNNFSVMEEPFTIMKSPSSIPYRKVVHFPQSVCEFVVIARRNGVHPDGFKPDFQSPFHAIKTTMKRRFSGLDSVPVPSRKLLRPGTKSPFFSDEKNVDAILEMIQTFCPDEGNVLDPYAGVMNTARACAISNRTCVSIEEDQNCFTVALKRLAKLIADDEQNSSTFEPSQSPRKVRRLNDDREKISQITRGSKVSLLLDDQIVGTAQLQEPTTCDDMQLCRTLHGASLSQFQDVNEDLVCITKCVIHEPYKSDSYPFRMPGIECPSKLKDVFEAGIYVWDLNRLRVAC